MEVIESLLKELFFLKAKKDHLIKSVGTVSIKNSKIALYMNYIIKNQAENKHKFDFLFFLIQLGMYVFTTHLMVSEYVAFKSLIPEALLPLPPIVPSS